MNIKRTHKNAEIDRTAISLYDNYCDGYGATGNEGNGYVSVLKVSTGEVEKTEDFLLDGIVAYDRAEANDAYVGQINMLTASSFCGIAGQIWGFDMATTDEIENNEEKPVLVVKQYDGSDLPIYDAAPLLKAGISLFGTEKDRRYPPVPGGHIICANKSVTAYRPKSDEFKENEGFGVWCFIAISITRNRENSADLFIEDAGIWTQDDQPENLENFLKEHRKNVAWSITSCGEDQSVLYSRTYIGYAYRITTPGYIGTALTCAPYVSLAKNAIPKKGFHHLNDITLSEWEALQQNSKNT
ncbi:histidine decarboxylase, pyruvoyl type [Cellulophaga sp. Z1A5H]|uniref:histidine decarboxylase, pyruvoyl type n=1 Tax=Cellulophaga sp. Z1A5H TaxID=2687291 RepID=UPI0013FE15E1|nr:histidine decarboxylase, pyruvoyl type [Cellulophaga sp. Z1A5H]